MDALLIMVGLFLAYLYVRKRLCEVGERQTEIESQLEKESERLEMLERALAVLETSERASEATGKLLQREPAEAEAPKRDRPPGPRKEVPVRAAALRKRRPASSVTEAPLTGEETSVEELPSSAADKLEAPEPEPATPPAGPDEPQLVDQPAEAEAPSAAEEPVLGAVSEPSEAAVEKSQEDASIAAPKPAPVSEAEPTESRATEVAPSSEGEPDVVAPEAQKAKQPEVRPEPEEAGVRPESELAEVRPESEEAAGEHRAEHAAAKALDPSVRARMAAAVQAVGPAPRRPQSALRAAAAGLGGVVPPSFDGPRLPTRSELEEQLGARLPVWIGSIALLLGGASLVKYTFDRGILTEEARVALGVILGVLLLGGAERMRTGSARVASGLAASGVGVLFASFLSATNVFGLVPPAVGFGLMALTTAVAVALSLRHGALVAVLGLVGGFMTPLLVATGSGGNPFALFSYLLILQIGLMVVTRRKGWWHLAGLTLVASMLWVVLWLFGSFQPTDDLWLGTFLLMSTATFVSAGLYGDAGEAWGDSRIPRLMARAAIGLSLLLLAAVTVSAGFRTLDWAFFAILGSGCIALARLDPNFEELPWLTATLTGVLVAVWPLQQGSEAGLHAVFGPISAPIYLLTIGGLGVIYAGGSYLALWGSERPVRWAALSSLASVTYVLAAYWGMGSLGQDAPWGPIAIALGAVCVAASGLVARRREALPDGNVVLAVLAAGATAFVSLAVALELQREWISVAWAAETAALAWIAYRLKAPQMRILVWPLAAMVGIRLLANPLVVYYPIGTMPIVNWLLYGYGIPIVSFAVASRFSHLDGDERLSQVLQWLTLFLGLAMVTLQVRQFFNPASLLNLELGFVEGGTYTVIWLAYGWALLRLARRWPFTSLSRFGQGMAALGIGASLLVNGVVLSPLWSGESVGTVPGMNWLLWVYGIPAVLGLAIGRELGLRDDRYKRRSIIAWFSGLTLLLLLIALQVNHVFHGEQLRAFDADLVERGTYVIAWLMYATVLFAVGKRFASSILAQYGWFVTGLALVVALVTTIIANPVLTGESVGTVPIANWLLWVYGVPAVLCLAIGWLRRDIAEDANLRAAATTLGLCQVAFLVTLEVRQWFYGDALDAGQLMFVERGAYVVAWLVLALALLGIAKRLGFALVSRFSQTLAALAIGTALLVNSVALSPLLTGEAVGDLTLLNWLLWVYGAPAALSMLLAYELERDSSVDARRSAAAWVSGLALLLVLVTYEVNQLFHGGTLQAFGASLVERGTYVVAWLAYAHALFAVDRRWGRPLFAACGWLVTSLAAAAALVTTIFLNPILTGQRAGDTQIVNWLLWVYGVPAALALGVAWVRRDVVEDRHIKVPAAILAGLTWALALVTMEVRQWFHPGDLGASGFTFIELGTYVVAWLLTSLVLLRIHRHRPVGAVNLFGQGIAALALVFALLVNGLIWNPLWTGENVGSLPILNWLVWAYGVPALLAIVVAAEIDRQPSETHYQRLTAWYSALTLVLILITLEVNQLFHGAVLRPFAAALVERGTYVAAWLGLAVGLLYTGIRLGRPTLRRYGWLVTGLGVLGGLTMLLLRNPVLTGESVGSMPIFNCLWWVYGATGALALVAGWLVREADGRERYGLSATAATAVALLIALVTLLVRQYFQGEYLDGGSVSFVERSTYAVSWVVSALVLLQANKRWPLRVFGYIAAALAVAGLWLAVAVGLWPGNPLFTGEPVGELPLANWLLWAYGVPAVLCLVLARRLRHVPDIGRGVSLALQVMAFALAFSLVTLEVRQAFQGSVLTGDWTAAERYSYSLAWIIFATALLIAGILAKSQGPRYASLAVMMLAVGKVFLYDTGNVTDLLRVASYLGLGLSLFLLAWLYQRFVFVEEAT